MLLNEDMFEILDADVPNVANADIEVADIDTTVPEAGPEVGVETLLMQAIKDVYGMIEGYNSLSIALTDIGNESAAISVADIIKMEHANIGVLQDILKEISPNAEAVDINESLNESFYSNDVYSIIEDVCNICNVDISNVDISHYDENVIYLFNVSEEKASRFFGELKNRGIRCGNFKSLDGYKAVFDSSNFNESLNEELEDIGSKGGIYKDGNKVGEYWYSYGASSYGFNLINGETHHWYSKEELLDFLKEHNYTAKRI